MLIKPLAFAVLTTLLAFLSLGSFKSTAKAADIAMTRADFNYAYQAFQRSAKSKDEQLARLLSGDVNLANSLLVSLTTIVMLS